MAMAQEKVKEVGVQDFNTVLEVQPRYRRSYEALKRDIALHLEFEKRGIDFCSPTLDDKDERVLQRIEDGIGRRIEIVLGEYLENAGVISNVSEEDLPRFDVSIKNEEIGLSSNLKIRAFPVGNEPERFSGYSIQLKLTIPSEQSFHIETKLWDEGSPGIRYVSDALRLLFPKKYNGTGIPAVSYQPGMIAMAPLSRLPQVKEHIYALGKELLPHIHDLDAIVENMEFVGGNTGSKLKGRGSPEVNERLNNALRREYLYTLLEAMGREI